MPEISRRTALKTGLACAAGAALPRLARAALEPTDLLGRFVIRIAQHPQLATTNGSKIFAVPGVTGTGSEIVVTRQAGNVFSALSAICTHEGCQVEPYSTANQRINCPCHGSQFRLDGTVAAGPAVRALERFQATFDSATNAVFVEIPEFVGLETDGDARALRLEAPGPNPAAAEVPLRFTLPTAMNVHLSLYDAQGRTVAVLVEGPQEAGLHTAVWDAHAAPAGVYFARLWADGQMRTRPLTVAR